MYKSPIMNRRDLLRIGALGGASLLLGGVTSGLLGGCVPIGAVPATANAPSQAPVAEPEDDSLEIALRVSPGRVALFPGDETRVLNYRGQVIRGDAAALQEIPGSYLGPILRVRKGQRVRVHFTNELSEETIVHWHGLHMPEDMDGHPRLAIGAGETYDYDFRVVDRAGTYWYHPHPHGRTGPQVYGGLAGLLTVTDEEESKLGLPSGERDVPLVIQDRSFTSRNQLAYLGNGMMDNVMGFLGNQVLVNGRPDYVLPVSASAYRFRLLNGSNSRVYKLAWDDGTPLTVIGTDGGLLERPVKRDYVMLAQGERVELWVDLRDRPIGSELRLKSLAFEGEPAGGMMMGMMGSARGELPQGAEIDIMRVRVEREGSKGRELPDSLGTIDRHQLAAAVNRENPRRIGIAMRRMAWTLNGRTFQMDEVARDEVVRLGDLEIWEFANQQGPMWLMHPMHIHNVQFQVIERSVAREFRAQWDTVRSGFVDEGWKDTVLVMPGERVKVLVRFEHYPGLYLYHCHNLEHEDMGMMRNYRIEA